MNLKELNGRSIKKHLKSKNCHYKWHNKNCAGGNFAIHITSLNNNIFVLSGYYDEKKEVYELKIGELFSSSRKIEFLDFNDLMKKLSKIILLNNK